MTTIVDLHFGMLVMLALATASTAKGKYSVAGSQCDVPSMMRLVYKISVSGINLHIHLLNPGISPVCVVLQKDPYKRYKQFFFFFWITKTASQRRSQGGGGRLPSDTKIGKGEKTGEGTRARSCQGRERRGKGSNWRAPRKGIPK